jgi:cytochrome c-type biogenesis protein CcmH/NrfG
MATNNASTSNSSSWTSSQAYVFAIICLVIGIAAGYFVRGSGGSAATPAGATSQASSAAMGSGQITPEQLKHMADTQAAPILQQLKNSPNDPTLLAQAGNVYYDAQLYQDSIEYYKKALALDPKNASIRTDMATAVWYLGDADTAITELNMALLAEPNKAQTLFNLGMIKWRGKMDVKGAVADWEKLLKTSPDYPERQHVEELLAQVKQHTTIAPGTKSSKPIQ